MEKWHKLKLAVGNKRNKERRLLRDLESVRKEIADLNDMIAKELEK